MINLQMFDTEEDLMKLTGLSHDELWENDFDTDDWDVGFVSDVPLTTTEYYDDYDDDDEGTYEDPIDGAWWLVHRMDEYCVGYTHVVYGGRHYYMVHHA